MGIILSVILAGALFLALVMNLTLKPDASKKVTSFFMGCAVLGGIVIYGSGLAETTGNIPLSIVRAPLCVIRMFVGVADVDAIKSSTVLQSEGGLLLFWILHLLAFYSTASAAMITLGAGALRRLRQFLSRRGDLTLIFGINDNSIHLGRECLARGGSSVVFVADNADPNTVSELNVLGMSVVYGSAAVASEKKVIRRFHLKKRKLTVYALDEAADQNLFYAMKLKKALEAAKIPPENTRITLPGAEDILVPMLQVSADNYGFGYVYVFQPASNAARALIQICPPWNYVHFGPDGRSTENFECVIVGFGEHGQAVLKQLVMNGQFAGSTFKAAIFSPDLKNESGYMREESGAMFEQYDIRGFEADARSIEFYEYIHKNLNVLKMIVVCTGNERTNSEISDNLMLFLKRRNAEKICVVQCGNKGVRYQATVGSEILNKEIYTIHLLSAEDADRFAIILNATYDKSERTDWEKWVACDSFGKMSSRASADFFPAFIKASGSSEEEILQGNWHPDGELLQVLGETEHLRWNAFHFAMGYSTMPKEEYEKNSEEYLRCKKEGIPYKGKIGRNTQARTHACLIAWDELDELSERENRITGKQINYKQTDIDNVIALPKLLATLQKMNNDTGKG